MGKDYYSILGVGKGADDGELKKGTSPGVSACSCHSTNSSLHAILMQKAAGFSSNKIFVLWYAAYRKLAMKWHPVSTQTTAMCGMHSTNSIAQHASVISLAASVSYQWSLVTYSGVVTAAQVNQRSCYVLAGQEPRQSCSSRSQVQGYI